MSVRHKILVVDKNHKYPFLFEGLRKNKFSIGCLRSFAGLSESELSNFNMFFMVIYEPKDIFELLKVYKGTIPIVIASDNSKIIKKMKNLGCLPLIDLSIKGNINSGVYECINQMF